VLQAAGNLLQLFCINQDFGTEWQRFTTAADDNSRKLTISIPPDSFPYWANVLGMDDKLTASFCCIDWNKHKLSIAPQTIDIIKDPNTGWTLSIDKNSTVFAFLKKNMANKVYMPVSYLLA